MKIALRSGVPQASIFTCIFVPVRGPSSVSVCLCHFSEEYRLYELMRKCIYVEVEE
jgi:hypothetical protein